MTTSSKGTYGMCRKSFFFNFVPNQTLPYKMNRSGYISIGTKQTKPFSRNELSGHPRVGLVVNEVGESMRSLVQILCLWEVAGTLWNLSRLRIPPSYIKKRSALSAVQRSPKQKYVCTTFSSKLMIQAFMSILTKFFDLNFQLEAFLGKSQFKTFVEPFSSLERESHAIRGMQLLMLRN